MKTVHLKSFINKGECTQIANRLQNCIDLHYEDEKLENARDQFIAYSCKAGGYFCNIISEPHFTQKEITRIIYLSNLPVVHSVSRTVTIN